MLALEKSLEQALSEARIDQLAKETGFCKRKRKLTPKRFVEMVLHKTFNGSQESLLDHTRELQVLSDVEIAKQSIDERFSTEAVKFIKALVADQIANNLDISYGFLDKFSRVFIHDSTRFKLPDHLKSDYKGYGVKGMSSGGALQFCFDLRSHQFISAELTPATSNDSLSAVENNWVEPNSLVLRDLGYYKIEGLKQIGAKGGFYISKANPRSHFFDKQGEKLDARKLLCEMNKKGLTHFSRELFIDRNERLPVRVIFCKVPQSVYEERVRVKNAKSTSRGWKMTEEYRSWCWMNILITNVPQRVLSDDQIKSTYKLRWQIELVFKTWKSHYEIHRVKKVKKERAEVYIYATLLLIMVHWRIFSWLQRQWLSRKVILSLYKFSKYMLQISSQFTETIILKKSSLKEFTHNFLLIDSGLIEKEKRSKKLCFSDIVYL